MKLKIILENNNVSSTPISKVRKYEDISTFERIITLDKNIGTDKFNGYKPTMTINMLTDIQGNLITGILGNYHEVNKFQNR